MGNFDLGDICGIVEHLREQSEMLDGMGAMLLILANHSEDIPEAPLMEDTWAYVLYDLADKTWKMKKKADGSGKYPLQATKGVKSANVCGFAGRREAKLTA